MRAAPPLLALAGLLLLATFASHPIVDESDPDALFAEASERPARWRLAHGLLAAAGFMVGAAALAALAEGWRADAASRAGWALLAAAAPAMVAIGALESATLAHLASQGDRAGFATWRSFANGLFGLVGVFAAGTALLARRDVTAGGWRRVAALVAMAASACVVAYLVGHEWSGIRALAPLFRAFALLALWLVVVGVSDGRPPPTAARQAASAPRPSEGR